jgi:hypothetical protein
MVHVTGDLGCLLPNCPVLEWLSLTKCRMDELSIGQELSRLHYLQVKYCILQKLDIRAPNLTMFLFAGRMIPILLGEPVKISEATVELITSSDCFSYAFTDLVDALSHVQSLSISFRIETKVCLPS